MRINRHFTSPRYTMEQWFTLPPVQVIATSDDAAWDSVYVRNVRCFPTQDVWPSPECQSVVVVLIQMGVGANNVRFPDGKTVRQTLAPGSLQLITPALEFDTAWEGSHKAAFIELRPDLMTELLLEHGKGDPAHASLAELLNFDDPMLAMLCTALAAEVEHESFLGEAYAEMLARLIGLHLLRHYGAFVPARLPKSGVFTAAQRRTVVEFIHEHLVEKHIMRKLALSMAVSVSHLDRLFRASFHIAPYQYILHLKVERAKHLLATTDLPLSEVAHECGFANQSHLTKHFSRAVGISPARYRRATRG